MTVSKIIVKGAKKLVGRGRTRRRGRGPGSNVEKKAAIDNGFVQRDVKGNIKTNKKGNPIPDVPAYRAALKSAKKVEQPTVETPTRTPVTPGFGPTGTATDRLAALRAMTKGSERGEIGKILQQSERARRADLFPAPAERGRRTATVDPVSGQIVEGGPNTRLRSLHRPDYGEKHEQAVLFLREKFPGKSEKWYEREAIKLVERDFPRVERGEEVISGPSKDIAEAMGLRSRKRGGIVRRRKGGAIGVGAALRGYGKGYKKGGKI